MRLVIDTNVLVSGLLNPSGSPGRVVDGVLLGELVAVVDDRLLAEYAEVLARPRLEFDPARREQVLQYLRDSAEHIVAAPLGIALPDADDLPLLEVAHQAGATALVTGNLRHFPEAARAGVRGCTPTELVAEWARRRVGAAGPPLE